MADDNFVYQLTYDPDDGSAEQFIGLFRTRELAEQRLLADALGSQDVRGATIQPRLILDDMFAENDARRKGPRMLTREEISALHKGLTGREHPGGQ
jgi:hypothetical protein